MDVADMLAFDELAAETGAALWPAEIALGGVTLAATVVPPRQGANLGAFADEPEPVLLVVRVSKTVLPAKPAYHTALEYGEKRWKVRTVSGGAHEAQWTLTCDPAP